MSMMRACHELLHYVSYPMTGEQRLPAKVRREVIVLILVLSTLYLQGCANTAGPESASQDSFTVAFLALETATIRADGQSSVQLRVMVTDKDNKAIPNITVALSTTAGRLSATSVATRTDGIGAAILTAPTTAVIAIVTAQSGSFSDSVVVTFAAGDPVALTLSAIPESVSLRGVSIIQARVLDANGNPVPERGIRFVLSVNGSGATLEPANGSVPANTELSLLTDVNGRSNVIYRAGPVPKTDTIRVIAGAAAASVSINVQAPGPVATVAAAVPTVVTELVADILPEPVATALGDAVTLLFRQIPADFPSARTSQLLTGEALDLQVLAAISATSASLFGATDVRDLARLTTSRAETVISRSVTVACPSAGEAIGSGTVTIDDATTGNFAIDATIELANCNGLTGTMDITTGGTFQTGPAANTVAFDVVCNGTVTATIGANTCRLVFGNLTESAVVNRTTETIAATVNGSLELLCPSLTVQCRWQDVDLFNPIALAAGCR